MVPDTRVKRSAVVWALVALLCLACSWSSTLIIANTGIGELTVRAEYAIDPVRAGILPIRFAAVSAIGDEDAWYDAPVSAVTVDSSAGTVSMTLPPGTATRLGHASNCGSPAMCDDFRFGVKSLELHGRSGSFSADRAQLRAAFVPVTTYRWVLWYPWMGAHGFRQNLGLRQAAIFGLAIGVAVFTLWAAFTVARTPMRARAAWVIVALSGLGELAINWTTGEISTRLVTLQIPTVSMAHGEPFGPWVIACSFPLGAILALHHRRRVLGAVQRASTLASEGPAA